jgi:hypothetical protein
VRLRDVRGLGEGPRGLGGQGLTDWGRKPKIFWALDDLEVPVVKPLVFHHGLLTLTKGCVMLSTPPPPGQGGGGCGFRENGILVYALDRLTMIEKVS